MEKRIRIRITMRQQSSQSGFARARIHSSSTATWGKYPDNKNDAGVDFASRFTSISGNFPTLSGSRVRITHMSVRIQGDDLYEPDETIVFELSENSNGSITRRFATLTIVDDDPKPTITVRSPEVNIDQLVTFSVRFELTLSGSGVGFNLPVNVEIVQDNVGLQAGSPTSYIFAPGLTRREIEIFLFGGTPAGESGTVTMNVLSDDDYTVGNPGSAVVTVVRAPIEITITGESSTVVGDGVNDLVFTIRWNQRILNHEVFLEVPVSDALNDPLEGMYTTDASFALEDPNSRIQIIRIRTAQLPVGGDSIDVTITFRDGAKDDGTSTYAIAGVDGNQEFTITVTAPIARLSVVAPSQSVTAESGGSIAFTVSLNLMLQVDVTVPYELAGTAVMDTDYTDTTSTGSPAVAGTPLTIPAGQTMGMITLTLIDDTADEEDETVTVSLTGTPTNAEHSETASEITASVTITDNDDQPKVSVAGPAATVAEGEDLLFTFTLVPASGKDVTVPFTLGGTAEAADYMATPLDEVVFAEGETTKTLTIATVDDALYEDDVTVTVELGMNLIYADPTDTPADRTATGTIANNDPLPKVSVAGPASAVTEGAGPLIFTFNLAPVSGKDATVPFTLGGTAESGTDYTPPSETSIMISAGETTAEIAIVITDDSLDEPEETITVALGAALTNADPADINADRSANGAIADNDFPVVTTAAIAPLIFEGADAEFMLSREGDLTGELEVQFTVTETLGDMLPGGITLPETATFAAYSAVAAVAVTTHDDEVQEPASVLTLTLTANAAAYRLGVSKNATVTIRDNESPPQVSVSAPIPNEVVEGEDLVFTVLLSRSLTVDVAVPFTLAGTAVSGTDYTAPASREAIIQSGNASATITLATTDNELDESDKTVTVTIGAPAVEGIFLSSVPSEQAATATITDNDDSPKVSVAGPAAAAGEGENLVFTFTLTPFSEQQVTVPFMLGGTATRGTDYTPPSDSSVMFAAGETTLTLTIITVDDLLDEEEETVTVSLEAPLTNANPAENIADQTASGTIADNDLPIVKVAPAPPAVTEGTDAVFTLTREGVLTAELDVQFTVTQDSGDVFPASPTLPATATFAASSSTVTVAVDTSDDTVDETAGILTLTLSANQAVYRVGTPSAASVRVKDDDGQPEAAFDATGALTVQEGESLDIAVSLSHPINQEIRIPYTLRGGSNPATLGDDYTDETANGTNLRSPLVFAASELEKTITLMATADFIADDGETVIVTLQAPAGGLAILASNSSITITITSHDPANPPQPGLETPRILTGPPTFEPDVDSGYLIATFDVSLSRQLTYSIVVPYAVSIGPVEDAGSQAEFIRAAPKPKENLASSSLTFEAGDLTKSIPVVIPDNDSPGTGRQLALRLGSPTLNQDAAPSPASVLPEIALPGGAVADITDDGVLVATHTLESASIERRSEALAQAVAAAGRAHSTGVVNAIWSRVGSAASGAGMPFANVGGRSLDTGAFRSGENTGQAAREVARLFGVDVVAPKDSSQLQASFQPQGEPPVTYNERARHPIQRNLAGRSRFALPINGDGESGSFTFWGQGANAGYEATAESEESSSLMMDGSATSFHFGIDRRFRNGAALGIALSRTSGSSDYEFSDRQPGGETETSITSVAPYIHWSMSKTMRVWIAAGAGSGTAALSEAEGDSVETDVSMTLIAGGLRGQPGFAGKGIAMKADVFFASLGADGVEDQLAEVSAGASRIRAAAEGSRARTLSGGGSLAGRAEIGLRQDSGDDMSGVGADAVAGFNFANSRGSLRLDGRFGMLLFHGQDGAGESGFALGLVYEPGSRRRGLQLSLEPGWNASLAESSAGMWDAQSALSAGLSDSRGASMKMRIGHGLGMMQDQALLTAYSEVGTTSESGSLRIGAEVEPGWSEGGYHLNLYTEHLDSASGPERAVMLRATFNR